MREAVSDILLERAQITDGTSRVVLRMLVLSMAAHALLILSLIFAPSFWASSTIDKASPMIISIGGAEGPDAGGANMLSAKPIQRVAEPDEKPTRPAPPAEKPPEMAAPDPVTKPAPKTPVKPIEKPAEKSSTRKPTAGKEVTTGAARADTGAAAQTPFGGLSTGGGGTGGAKVDVPNFCCPEYIGQIVSQIKRNWSQNQSSSGKNTLKFVIQRDGTLTGIEVEESAGTLLDLASQRALQVTKQVTPLPREFTGSSLTIHLIFEYSR